MKKEFLEKMRSSLEKEKTELERELSNLGHRIPQAAEADYEMNFPNIGDKEDENASEVAQFSDNLSLESELEKSLRDVESALERLEKDEYGICKYCKEEINEKRLEARSTSSSCIKCKKTLTQEV